MCGSLGNTSCSGKDAPENKLYWLGEEGDLILELRVSISKNVFSKVLR